MLLPVLEFENTGVVMPLKAPCVKICLGVETESWLAIVAPIEQCRLHME